MSRPRCARRPTPERSRIGRSISTGSSTPRSTASRSHNRATNPTRAPTSTANAPKGKSRREAIRCLKRLLVRVVFNTLKTSPALTEEQHLPRTGRCQKPAAENEEQAARIRRRCSTEPCDRAGVPTLNPGGYRSAAPVLLLCQRGTRFQGVEDDVDEESFEAGDGFAAALAF